MTRRLISTLEKSFTSLRGNSQQDSHELLHFILLLMDRQTSEYWRQARLRLQTFGVLHIDPVSVFLSIPKPPVAGLSVSLLRFPKCGHTSSSTLAVTSDISLPIPETSASLYDCLSAFFREETIDDVRCSQCAGESRTCRRRILIAKPPQLLCLQLNRLLPPYKIDKHISFPFILELPLATTWDLGNTIGPSLMKRFRLKAVISHHGSANGGHYTAFRQASMGKWIHISDTQITPISQMELAMVQAYMLFYEMIPEPITS